MIQRCPPILALTIALAGAADSPPRDPLETIHAGNCSQPASLGAGVRILNWNVDRGKHFGGIVAAIRETRPDLCIFQEVDLGARRTGGQDVARELGKAFAMNYAFAPEFRELRQSITEHRRLLQLDEVLADAQQYPPTTPVIVAGDRSCFGERRIRTHILIGALDWIFVRGPVACEGAEVHRDLHASDHFPISAQLRF